MKTTSITFKSIADFKSRIATLWQNQKEGEEYEFIFEDQETENEFNKLMMCFMEKEDKAELVRDRKRLSERDAKA